MIPYIGPKGNIYNAKFKCIEPHDHKDPEIRCPKVLSIPDVRSSMFNTQALTANTDSILLAEGEPDCMTFTACGWPAVGVPGADAWQPHFGRVLAGFSKVILLAHGDDAGRKFASKVMRALPSTASVRLCQSGDDANSVYVREGIEGLKALLSEREDE